MFRDTFAVEMLLAGCSHRSGIASARPCLGQDHRESYSPFVKARQMQLQESVRKAWKSEQFSQPRVPDDRLTQNSTSFPAPGRRGSESIKDSEKTTDSFITICTRRPESLTIKYLKNHVNLFPVLNEDVDRTFVLVLVEDQLRIPQRSSIDSITSSGTPSCSRVRDDVVDLVASDSLLTFSFIARSRRFAGASSRRPPTLFRCSRSASQISELIETPGCVQADCRGSGSARS